MRLLAIVILLLNLSATAVDESPLVLRACIDTDNNTVTLSWNKVVDACGSFTKCHIYANVDAGPYELIHVEPDINTTAFVHSLPDANPTRTYFMTIHTLCDGLDSIQTNTVSVDQIFPSITELDSVSYDLATQNIIAGWTANVTPDTKGYQVYDYTGNIGNAVGYSITTTHVVTTDPNDVFPVVIATEDSCSLFAPLSSPHTVSSLSSNIDTCLREINLSWTRYKGWLMIDSQQIRVSINGGSFDLFSSVNAAVNSFTISNITLGDTYSIYIRSFTNKSGVISSSSNTITITTRALSVPTYTYLDKVTVANSGNVEMEWTIDNTTDQTEFIISRSTLGGSLSELSRVAVAYGTNNYFLADATADYNNSAYTYLVESTNKCNELTSTSNSANTIFLEVETSTNHNPYINWDGDVLQYELEHRLQSSSTWNTFQLGSDPIVELVNDTFGCYRVIATENINSYGKAATSTSNEVCTDPPFQWGVTTGINPDSENNRFVVWGVGINEDLSSYSIYNRWGEKLTDQNISQPWVPQYKGELIQSGSYVYILTLYQTNGSKKTIKGVFDVIH